MDFEGLQKILSLFGTVIVMIILAIYYLEATDIERCFWDEKRKREREITLLIIFSIVLFFGNLVIAKCIIVSSWNYNIKIVVNVVAALSIYICLSCASKWKKKGEEEWENVQSRDMYKVSARVFTIGYIFTAALAILATNSDANSWKLLRILLAFEALVEGIIIVREDIKQEKQIKIHFRLRDRNRTKYYCYFREGDYFVCGSGENAEKSHHSFRLFPLSQFATEGIELHFSIQGSDRETTASHLQESGQNAEGEQIDERPQIRDIGRNVQTQRIIQNGMGEEGGHNIQKQVIKCGNRPQASPQNVQTQDIVQNDQEQEAGQNVQTQETGVVINFYCNPTD
ncbi:hypothetical protein [Stomatobaculum longum]|uniref:hypothetical protein n=1 Tax=Stomatobaculum longum TaxID=796942 RepID=UPI0028053834|nr:hypothetical protein [Stomatobaculum longum]